MGVVNKILFVSLCNVLIHLTISEQIEMEKQLYNNPLTFMEIPHQRSLETTTSSSSFGKSSRGNVVCVRQESTETCFVSCPYTIPFVTDKCDVTCKCLSSVVRFCVRDLHCELHNTRLAGRKQFDITKIGNFLKDIFLSNQAEKPSGPRTLYDENEVPQTKNYSTDDEQTTWTLNGSLDQHGRDIMLPKIVKPRNGKVTTISLLQQSIPQPTKKSHIRSTMNNRILQIGNDYYACYPIKY